MGKILAAFGAGLLAVGVTTIGFGFAEAMDKDKQYEELKKVSSQKQAIVNNVSVMEDFKQYLKDKFNAKIEDYQNGEISKVELDYASKYLDADSEDEVIRDFNVESYLREKGEKEDAEEFIELRDKEAGMQAERLENKIETFGNAAVGAAALIAGVSALAVEGKLKMDEQIAWEFNGGSDDDAEENYFC